MQSQRDEVYQVLRLAFLRGGGDQARGFIEGEPAAAPRRFREPLPLGGIVHLPAQAPPRPVDRRRQQAEFPVDRARPCALLAALHTVLVDLGGPAAG